MRGYRLRFLVVLGRPGCQTSTLIKFFSWVCGRNTGGRGRVVYCAGRDGNCGLRDFYGSWADLCTIIGDEFIICGVVRGSSR